MVLITFKTITQISFTLELEPSLTIAEVKQKIAEERGDDYAVELQKLIYNGKILTDESNIQDTGIESSKFVVVMLQRKPAPRKVDPAPATNSATTATTTTTSTASSGKLETTPAPEQLSNNSTPAPASTTSNSTPAPAADEEVITPEQEEMIKNIVSMGYPRDQTIAMLRASLWNPDRAVDLLLTGDPEGEAMGFVEEDSHAIASNLDVLGQLPQIEELRHAVRENPSILPSLMRQIAQINPDLMNAISQDQEGFLRLLGGAGAGAGAQAAERAAPQNTIRLTEEEHAAVMRIKDMGFNVPEHLILEAYLACDKDEQLAVDYILQRMDEGEL
ncbi:unnamed protein product [Auanema sp. JU1783]|nr:unnamed protein product [Auanema sp. JU1783]